MTTQSLSSHITSLIRDGEIPLSDAWGKLLDDVAAVERKLLAAHDQEPVFFVEIEGDDWINAGRIEGKDKPDLGLLPDGINYLYANPAPVHAVPEKCPTEIRDLMASHSDELFNDDDAQEIWNACRAAMLGNTLVIPAVPKEE